MSDDPIRQAIGDGQTVFVSWHTLGVALALEMAGRAGWRVALIDQQHGFGGQAELLAGLTAARAGGLAAIVRVAGNDTGLIGRALDAGAQGVMCPMINTGDEARRFVDAVKYPPLGRRSWGPYRAALMIDGGDDIARANGWTLACAQIETRQAIDNLEAILATDGLDAILVGPNDLAVSMTGARDISATDVLEAVATVRERAVATGVITWIFANDAAYARRMIADGWQMVSIGSDGGWLAAGTAAPLAEIRDFPLSDQ